MQYDPDLYGYERGQMGGLANSSWLAPPPALLSHDLYSAPLTISASMRQLRWTFNGISMPTSNCPRAEEKWHRDMVCLIPERDWIASWVAVHKAPTSSKVRSFLWKLMHRCLNLLFYEYNAICYGRGDMCPLCSLIPKFYHTVST